jgi:hypothetical protein
VNSYFHVWECVDADVVAIGTVDVDNDPVALYLGYYD